MATMSVDEARTQFSRLLGRAEAGEEIVIVRAGKPVAKIMPPEGAERPGKRKLGWAKGAVPDDWKADGWRDELGRLILDDTEG